MVLAKSIGGKPCSWKDKSMSSVEMKICDLQPKNVFSYFEEISAIPHGSGNTKKISNFCVNFAKTHGLRYRQDSFNNVIIWKEGSNGYENCPAVILQGHIDMVCTKADTCTKEMSCEGLDLETDGKYVWAKGTSLGADNGIAVAMILSILSDDSLPHPPIEAVFTVDEETGMQGASILDCSDLKGKKYINLDTEVEGLFVVSSAGGICMDSFVPCKQEVVSEGQGYIVTVKGLLGGHSGADINKGRASANCLMARALYGAIELIPAFRVSDIRGGEFDNVICPRSDALVYFDKKYITTFENYIAEFNTALKDEYYASDAAVELSCEKRDVFAAMSVENTKKLLHVLLAIPQGVQEMSMAFPNLIQTSINWGKVSTNESGVEFSVSIRSCISSQKNMMHQKISSAVKYVGGTVKERNEYPGWQYKAESPYRDMVLAMYKELSGNEPDIRAIHCGIECGMFADKISNLDAISMGPNILGIHSINERLDVESTARFYTFLCEVLQRSKSN